jgi:hypothetical protein
MEKKREREREREREGSPLKGGHVNVFFLLLGRYDRHT